MTTQAEIDTKKHIRKVSSFMDFFAMIIKIRGDQHDSSKLKSPEKEHLEKINAFLKYTTYGSNEYFDNMIEEFTDHHYKENRHHPEHFKNGINDMDLIDVFEMFCDWCAAIQRHKNGSFGHSITHNKKRFNMNPQLVALFKNTFEEYKEILSEKE